METSFPHDTDPFKCDGHQSDTPLKYPFWERIFFLKTTRHLYTYTPIIAIWAVRVLTVFVCNTGNAPIQFHIQNTPDGCHFVNDPQVLSLTPGETGTLTPYLFSKGLRIVGIGGPSTAQVWVQMQM